MKTIDYIQLFAIPKFQNSPHLVARYKKFLEIAEVGFSDKDAKIKIRQIEKPKRFVSPPDHFFVFEIEAEDIGNSNWLTLELDISPLNVENTQRVTTLISASSSSENTFRVVFRVFRANNSFEDLELGSFKLLAGDEFCQFNFSQPLSLLFNSLGESPKNAKLLLFAPPLSGSTFSIAMCNVFLIEE